MKNTNTITNALTFFLFILLIITGIISYRSIDWNVLKVMEQQKIVLPTSIPQAPISTVSTDSTSSSTQK